MAPLNLMANLKLIVIVTAFVAIRSPIRTVRCDEVSAKKLVDSDSSDGDFNVMHLSRQSDVRVRSVLPNTGKDVEPTLAPPVSEATLANILSAAETLSSQKCKDDIRQVVAGIQRGQHWALGMYDASVKEPVGIEYGDTYQFGSFDECLGAFHHHYLRDGGLGQVDARFQEQPAVAAGPEFNPQYCLADVHVQGYSIGALSSRDHQIKKINGTRIYWAICMPDSCSSGDVAQFLATATDHKVSVRPELCTREAGDRPLTTGEITFGAVMGGFFSIVLFCTCYNKYLTRRRQNMKRTPKSTMEEIVVAFSLSENLGKLVRIGSDDLGLSCLNGIKAAAMFFIVAGHSLVFMIGGPVQNSEFYAKQAKLVQNAFLLNSPLLVDTFLLLSGFLFARLLLLELEKRRGKINFLFLYIARYIRLTPAYLAIIAFYSTVLPRLGSGPLWNYRMGLEQERCEHSWWANLLYINNYVDTNQLCMFQSWYLSSDTQLFILAPLLLYPLWRCRKAGVALLGVAALCTSLIPFLVTYFQKIDPTFLVFADEISDLSANSYFANVYIKTHMRATAYVFGLITGYVVHVMQEENSVISKRNQVLIWTTSLICGLGSMFSVTIFYYPEYKYSQLESAAYAGLHRLGWSYLTGWIVLACVTGYAGRLRSFFAARCWVPISRLTYCAYLTNGLVELYHTATLRSPKYLSIMNLTGETISHAGLTFLAALVLCLVFESPIHGLEKILLRRDSRRRTAESSSSDNNSPSTSTSEESRSS